MSLKFIDIYNAVASQPWSMFDSDIQDSSEFDPALVLSINKALADLWLSFPFPFRIKSRTINTKPSVFKYPLFPGMLLSDDNDVFSISIDNIPLKPAPCPQPASIIGKPSRFYFKDNHICLYPTPDEVYKVDISFLSLVYSYDENFSPLFSLKNPDDTIDLPTHLNQLFLNALITKTMLFSIASKSDELYSGYKEQFDKAFKLLVKYSSPTYFQKKVTF